jgi:hypothetical protein
VTVSAVARARPGLVAHRAVPNYFLDTTDFLAIVRELTS